MSLEYRRNSVRPSTVYTPEWGSKTIAYLRTPTLYEYFRTYTPHGLVSQGIWVVANVMDATGQKYNLFRQYKSMETAMTVSSLEVKGLDATSKALFKPGEMYLGRCWHEIDEERGLIEVKPYLANPNAFSVTIRPQHVDWKDANGRVDLAFDALGPALEYYVPGLIEDGMYRSEPMRARGAIDGTPVSGYGVIDAAWGAPGCDWVQSKIFALLEKYWIVWLNVYDDDSTDTGIYCCGTDEFEAAYYCRNGEAMIGRHNHLDVRHAADGFIQSATLQMDDQHFEFTPDARVMQVASMVSWASGKVLNTADKRTPVQSFCWFEYMPK